MKQITIYNVETGQITAVRTVFNPADFALQCQPGEHWLHGSADPATHEVRDGAIVDRDPGVMEAEAIARAWVDLRAARTRMLTACDWTQVPDAPVDQAAWAIYRQALRDLPEHTTDPRSPPWPTRPV